MAGDRRTGAKPSIGGNVGGRNPRKSERVVGTAALASSVETEQSRQGLQGPVAELCAGIEGFGDLDFDDAKALAWAIVYTLGKIDDPNSAANMLTNSMRGFASEEENEMVAGAVKWITAAVWEDIVDEALKLHRPKPAPDKFDVPIEEQAVSPNIDPVKKRAPVTLEEHQAAKKLKDEGKAEHERRVGITSDFFGLQVIEFAIKAGLTPEEVKSLEALIGYSNKKRGPGGKAKQIDLVQMRAANAQQVAASGPARQKLSELVDKYSSSFGEVNDEKKKKEYQRRLALLETLLSDSNTVRGMQTAVYDRVGVNTSKTDPRSEIGIKARKEARGIRVGILKALDRIFKLAIEDRQAR